MNENPYTVYGRLKESSNISGYSLERAIGQFEWLLEDDRWMSVGYDDINEFIKSIKFSDFKFSIEQRKTIANKLAELQASQRATAQMIGVNVSTINRDINKDVANATMGEEIYTENEEVISEDVANATPELKPWFDDSGQKEVAQKKRNEEKKQEKEIRLSEEKNKRFDDIKGIDLRFGDFKEVLSDVYNIDAIITDPPYPFEFINCYSELSKYASEHLKDGGFCVAYSGQYNLPEVIKRMSEYLTYVWTFCLYHKGKKQLVNGVNIMCGWKPILVFSKGNKKMRFSAYDVVISEDAEKFSHEWQQSESGVSKLIEIFTEPGQLVVDPFAGGATFLKVANELNRNCIGAEINDKKEI